MRVIGKLRQLRLIDALAMLVLAGMLGVGLVRFVSGTVAVVEVHREQRASENPESGDYWRRVRQGLRDDERFSAWWGGRLVPYREGGDLLGVMSWHSVRRSLGNAIGVLAESKQPGDPLIDTVILPENRVALYGSEPGATFTRADGDTIRTQWAPPSRDIRRFSDVEVLEADYDPLLTEQELERLDGEFGFVEWTKALHVPSSGTSASRTWVLHAKEESAGVREYLLVPVEASPVGDEV